MSVNRRITRIEAYDGTPAAGAPKAVYHDREGSALRPDVGAGEQWSTGVRRSRQPLARYGIYKIIRRHASHFDDPRTVERRVRPHTFRHTAVHLLEASVEVSVIRGWLGHADLAITNRYAEINTKTKLTALQAAEPHDVPAGSPTNPIWRSDQSLLNWLASL